MSTNKINFDEMPPQLRMMYERMLLPKLREFDTDELEALRNFFNAEIDKLVTDREQGIIEGEAVDLDEQRRLLQEAIAAQQTAEDGT